MHIPKCGGSTLHSILERFYKPEEIFDIEVIDHLRLNTDDFIALSSVEKERIRLLKGHMWFGLHEQFSSKSEYISFMRNPVDRIISYYYYVKRRPKHRLYQLGLFRDDLSLYDFVTTIDQKDVNNGQIRFISGIDDQEELMLEKAMANIDQHFSFVGTLEKYNESLVALQKMYKWPTPYYKIANRTINRPMQNDIDEKTISAIRELNHGDIALYEQVNSTLTKHLDQIHDLDKALAQIEIESKKYYKRTRWKDVLKAKAKELLPTRIKNLLKQISNN
jgi:hypothetical protein